MKTKPVNISEDAWKKLIQRKGELTIKQRHPISMAEALDDLLKGI